MRRCPLSQEAILAPLVIPDTIANADAELTLLETPLWAVVFFVFHILDKLVQGAEEGSRSWEIPGHLEIRLLDSLWHVLTNFAAF